MDELLSPARIFKAIAGLLIATSGPVGMCEIKPIDPCTSFAAGSVLLMTTQVPPWLLVAALGERHKV